MIKQLTYSEKHKLYEAAVQNPDGDIEFIEQQFKKFFKKGPQTLREDFGGTGYLSCSWVKRNSNRRAWAIDLDSEPIVYGKENHYSTLTKTEKERMEYIQANVLENVDFKVDVAVAFNFSYFIFKKRRDLLEYFKKVREGLNDEGVFFIDLFGGTECRQELVEETEHDGFSYFWDCDGFNPLTNECLYHIHFKKDGVKYEEVFTYDWRMWSVIELREILEDAGFSKTVTYWEEDDEDGDGTGDFYISEKEENCESWVTYIAAIP